MTGLRALGAFLASAFLRQRAVVLRERLRVAHCEYSRTIRANIPTILIRALLAAEDHRFDRHCGVDPVAILRAVWCIGFRRTLAGGSTIQQQFVRTLMRDYERSFSRKFREMLLACLVAEVVPKTDIPGTYLSVAYFGWRMNGLTEACERMGMELRSLNPLQAVTLIASLKYPQPRLISLHRESRLKARATYILKLLQKNSSIFQSDRKAIQEREPVLGLWEVEPSSRHD